MAIQLERTAVDLDQLLLDPNNPRFFDVEGWEEVESNLYHLDSVQNAAYQLVSSIDVEQIEELRDSIRTNGFVPTEMIVVTGYAYAPERYVVVEGNRRLTAIRGIVLKSLHPDEDPFVQTLRRIEVLVYHPTGDAVQDQVNERILQGIRHIGGPKQWGAYQKANLVVQLHDELGQGWPEISQRLALGPRVTTRYYRAYKALRQMMETPEFADAAHPKLFSLFDEAVKHSAIRQWLTWSESTYQFTDLHRLPAFYRLLVGDESEGRPASITNPQHMRRLGELIMAEKPTVFHRFMNGELTIDDAVRFVNPDPVVIPFKDSVTAFLRALAEFPVDQLTTLSDTDVAQFGAIQEKLHLLERLRALMQQAAGTSPGGSAVAAARA